MSKLRTKSGATLFLLNGIRRFLLTRHFRNKRALIIGGSEGIGFSLAEALIGCGCDVVIASRNAAKLEHAVQRLRKQLPTTGEASIERRMVDITSKLSLQQLAGQFEGQRLDFLFVMPGVTVTDFFLDASAEDHRMMMEVNYFAQLSAIKSFLPITRQNRQFAIITSASALGRIGLFGYSGYCASKFAIVGLTLALRNEFAGKPISFSTVCAPAVQTEGYLREMHEKTPEMLKAELKGGLLSAAAAANSILLNVRHRKAIIVPGAKMKLILSANQIVPGLVRWFNDASVRKQSPN